MIFRLLKINLILFLILSCTGLELLAQISSDTADLSEKLYIRNITLSGNKITKERIIRRELIFKENDSLPAATFEQNLKLSHQNLMNTSLFNFVTIDTLAVSTHPKVYDIDIKFVELWYIWPVPIF